MKKIFYSLMCVMLLAACDEVKDDERLIYVKPAEVARNVLIEDFTGQRCLNCPVAHENIERLQAEYGADKVIAVSIHGGALAVNATATIVGLRTPLGDEYNAQWGIEAWPSGLIDRTSGVLTQDKWAAQVYTEIQKTTPVDLSLRTSYDADSRQVTIDVQTMSAEPFEGKLQLWLTEDAIVAPQQMPDGSMNRQYVHNNVLRAAVNGTQGTALTLKEGERTEQSFTFSLDKAWQADNAAIVGFVYNGGSGVMQVVRCPVVQTAE